MQKRKGRCRRGRADAEGEGADAEEEGQMLTSDSFRGG